MSGLLDFLQAASNSAASNVSGPVDGIAWLLRKAGIPVNDPVGGSKWMEQKGLTRPVQQGAAQVLGETAGLLGPIAVAAKAPQVAKGLLQAGDNLAAAPNVSRGLSGGQRGIFGGELAKTADKAALSKAKELEKAGSDPRAIWSETGWFKGGDGKWRFEIDDAGFKVNDWRGTGGGLYPEHPGMSAAYEGSHRIKVQPDARLESGTIGYAPWKDSLDFRMGDHGAIVYKPGESAPPDAWLHELQHYVQAREGFVSGGSPASVRPAVAAHKAIEEKLNQAAVQALTATDDVARSNAMQEIAFYQSKIDPKMRGRSPMEVYERLAGEAEARAVQARMNMTPAQRRATFPLDSYDVPIDQLIYK